MKVCKRQRSLFDVVMVAFLILSLGLIIYDHSIKKPNKLLITVGEKGYIDLAVPYTLRIDANDLLLKDDSGETRRANLNNCVVVEGDKVGSYQGKLYLFGLIPTGKVTVEVEPKNKVYVGGNVLGLVFNTEGALVTGFGDITSDKKMVSPAKGVLKEGDYITKINDTVIISKEQLIDIINVNGNGSVKLTISRDGQELIVSINPQKASDGKYKIGAYIRDDMAGIGTLTYVNPNDGSFGMLGHGIYDVDCDVLVDYSEAKVYLSKIIGITKGTRDRVGEIAGAINLNEETYIGTVTSNSEMGVKGQAYDLNGTLDKLDISDNDLYSLGYSTEIHKGKAELITNCLGAKDKYEVEITGIDSKHINKEKAIKIVVKDKRLLDKTGGVVQGLSGSPIIQNGKLVAVLTHVSVGKPEIGYGMFIETMIK